LHVDLLTQLTIEKSVLNIKLRHRPVANRGHGKKSAHGGHMSHRCKSLIVITTLLLLKATSHKTCFVALKRSIRASLNLVDPLACDGMNTGRRRDKIPSASAFKRSNLLGHGELQLGQNTSSKNSHSTSILIAPLSISSLSVTISGESLREIRYLLIISIDRSFIGSLGSNPVSLRSINSNNRWRRWHRHHWSKGARRTRDLATKNTPKSKAAHVSGKVRIVGTIEGQRAARNINISRRRRRHGGTSNTLCLTALFFFFFFFGNETLRGRLNSQDVW
jgi:hypothetical protein